MNLYEATWRGDSIDQELAENIDDAVMKMKGEDYEAELHRKLNESLCFYDEETIQLLVEGYKEPESKCGGGRCIAAKPNR